MTHDEYRLLPCLDVEVHGVVRRSSGDSDADQDRRVHLQQGDADAGSVLRRHVASAKGLTTLLPGAIRAVSGHGGPASAVHGPRSPPPRVVSCGRCLASRQPPRHPPHQRAPDPGETGSTRR